MQMASLEMDHENLQLEQISFITFVNAQEQDYVEGLAPMDIIFECAQIAINPQVVLMEDHTRFRINETGVYQIAYHFNLHADARRAITACIRLMRNGQAVNENISHRDDCSDADIAALTRLYLFEGDVVTLSFELAHVAQADKYKMSNPTISFYKVDIV